MKMKLILPLSIFISAVIALVISFVSFKTNSPNADDHHASINQMRILKHDNVMLNESLFEMVSGVSNDYDFITVSYKRLKDGYENLINSNNSLKHIIDIDFNQKVIDLGIAVEKKGALIERIKTDYALLRNSLDYYPLVAKEIKSIADKDSRYEKFIGLSDIVMYYVMSGDDAWFTAGISLIEELKDDLRHNSQVDKAAELYLINYLAHSEVILNGKQGLIMTASIQGMTLLNQSIDLLHASYMKHYSEHSKSAEIYWDVMLVASATLVFIILYMLVIIFQNSKELAASRAKSMFLANMSHEIRTPLTAIIGFGEATIESNQSVEERSAAVRSIVRNGKHLLSIINGMLDASKIESGKLETEILSVDLPELLVDVETVVRMLVAEKGLVFSLKYHTPVPNIIFTDPVRLKQILLNVCSNAVKFTKQGKIELGVSCLTDQHKIKFSVVDSGVGISKAEMEKLFKPFSQADASTTRKYGGTGLGLHISRELARRLGGDINLIGSTGQGTQFDIVIDTGSLDDAAFSETPPKLEYLNSTKKKSAAIPQLKGTVLIAEDTPDNQKLISYHIHKTGASTAIAENGKEALEKALVNEFDLILMDMRMPVMDGLEATEKIRASGYTKPIVALTANAFDEDVTNCREAGCDEFLSKPIDWGQFFQVLSGYLESASSDSDDELPLISEMLDGDPDVEDFIRSLVDDLPDRLETITQSYKDKYFPDLKEHLHKLKGTLGSFGYPHVSELAARMEIELKENKIDEFDLSLAELTRLIERIVKGRPQ